MKSKEMEGAGETWGKEGERGQRGREEGRVGGKEGEGENEGQGERGGGGNGKKGETEGEKRKGEGKDGKDRERAKSRLKFRVSEPAVGEVEGAMEAGKMGGTVEGGRAD